MAETGDYVKATLDIRFQNGRPLTAAKAKGMRIDVRGNGDYLIATGVPGLLFVHRRLRKPQILFA